jgi:hypothetical protein
MSKDKGQNQQGKMDRGQTSPGQPAGGRRMSDEAGRSDGAHMPETGGKSRQGEQQRMERDKADKGQGGPA